jgi:arylsulfatase A-like enzyme
MRQRGSPKAGGFALTPRPVGGQGLLPMVFRPQAPLFLLPAAFWLAIGLTDARAAPPNVLLIVADDQGYGDIGFNGNPRLDTPNLDALAASGIKLDQFHASPASATSRASLLTGRYHYRTGVSGDAPGEETLHGFEITLAEVFRLAGFATGCFGKWHNGVNWPHNAPGQGFDRFTGASLNRWSIGHDATLERDGKTFPTKGWITDVLTDEAIAFLGDQADAARPFFAYLSFGTPENTKEAPAKLLEKYRDREGIDDQTAAVYARIESIDANVGRLMAWLESRSLREKTIVWYLAATGPDVPPSTEKPRHNAHFRGAKGSVHEGGVRVPSFLSWPGRIPAGTRFRRITAQLDVLPSLIDLCEIAAPPLPWIDGMSLEDALLTGGQPERWPNRLLFTSWTPPRFDTPQASVAVRTDRWLALRDPNWRRGKLSEDHSGWELYDLDADPYETTDLADDYPYLLSDMRADYSRWMDETTDDGLGRIPTEIGHPEWPVVILRAREAILSEAWEKAAGDRGEHDPLTGWTGEDAKVRWPLKVKGKDKSDIRHTVEIECRLPAGAAPGAMRLSFGEKQCEFAIEKAGTDWQRITIGEIHFEPGTEGELILQPVKAEGAQSVEVREITLRKKGAKN